MAVEYRVPLILRWLVYRSFFSPPQSVNVPLLPRMYATPFLKTFSGNLLGSSVSGSLEGFKLRTFEKLSIPSTVRDFTLTDTSAALRSTRTVISRNDIRGLRTVTCAARFALFLANRARRFASHEYHCEKL